MRVSRKGAVHVHVVLGGTSLVSAACCLTQLRNQNQTSAHLPRIEVRAKAFDRNLSFVLVAMSATKRCNARRFRTAAAGGAIDYSHGNE